MRISYSRVIALALAFSGTAAVASAGQRSIPEQAASATITARVVETKRTGEAKPAVWGIFDIARDRTDGFVLWAGNTATGSACQSGVASGVLPVRAPIARIMNAALHVWELRARLISASVDRITFDLEWAHQFRDGNGNITSTVGDRRTITLPEGGRHLLDFVVPPAGDPNTCDAANLAIEVEARIANVQVASNSLLSYELWGQQRGTRDRTEVTRALAAQGERSRLLMRPFVWPVPGTNCEITLELSAHVMSRVRQDGRIDVSFEPIRSLRFGKAGESGGSSNGGGSGFSQLTLGSGETIQVAIPPLRGRLVSPCDISGPMGRLPGITIDRNLVTLDAPAFFGDQRSIFILTVTREP